MKKLIISILVASAALMPSVAKADNITADQAKAASAYYLNQNSHNAGLRAQDMSIVRQIDNPVLGIPAVYFLNAPKSGWVILAASTVLDPIIAFSADNTLDAANLPENLEWWLGNYAQAVSAVQEHDAQQDLPHSQEWLAISNGKLPETKDAAVVLINAYWSQGDDRNPDYNLYCPVVDGRTSVVGCVATALSQICHYYRYPVQPKGYVVYSAAGSTIRMRFDTVSFNYDLMPDGLSSSSTDEEISEVAKLCYAVGVAVKMDYNPDGSGSNNYNAIRGMKNNFKYEEAESLYREVSDDDPYGTGDTYFVTRIREDLLKSFPVYMSGASSEGSGADAAGHAWLCTGYRTENLKQYYMNWGWGGTRYGNGWFNLQDNNMRIPSMGYNFRVRQSVLLGLTPPEDSNRVILGIRNVEESPLSPAYPNPASVAVTLPYTLDAAADLQIYSMDGRLVETRRLAAGSGNAVVRVDNLPAGIYIYRLGGAAGKFIVK